MQAPTVTAQIEVKYWAKRLMILLWKYGTTVSLQSIYVFINIGISPAKRKGSLIIPFPIMENRLPSHLSRCLSHRMNSIPIYPASILVLNILGGTSSALGNQLNHI